MRDGNREREVGSAGIKRGTSSVPIDPDVPLLPLSSRPGLLTERQAGTLPYERLDMVGENHENSKHKRNWGLQKAARNVTGINYLLTRAQVSGEGMLSSVT